MQRELVEKIVREVAMAKKNNTTGSSQKELIFDAMNRHRIPDDSRDLRAAYEFAVLKKLLEEEKKQAEEKEERRCATENKERNLRERILARPIASEKKETALSLDDQFTDDLLKGNVSKEDMGNPHYEYQGKKPRDFYFGPPR